MKKLLLILLLGLVQVQAQVGVLDLADPVFLSPSVDGGGGGVTYVIDEDCEGTGTPSGWTDTGSPNWDYSSSPLSGSQSFHHNSTVHSEYVISDSDTYTAVVMFRVTDATPSATRSLFGFRQTDGSAVCVARLLTTGALALYTGGSDSSGTSDTISDSQDVYIKLVWDDSGTCSIEWNTTSSFSGSGTKYTSKTGGTTSTLTKFRLGDSGTSVEYFLDDVLVSTSDIP